MKRMVVIGLLAGCLRRRDIVKWLQLEAQAV